ncbi:MAG: circadian clock KaiB family protein [Candidatus Binataceae bacterium]|jgi:circadian clock protein KaiB
MAKIHRLKPKPVARTKKLAKSRHYVLRLFTSGSTPRSRRAIKNLCEICEANLKGQYVLEVIDIYQEPGRATESDIIAAPTLIKEEPLPIRRMIGDLSDRPKVLFNLAIGGGAK